MALTENPNKQEAEAAVVDIDLSATRRKRFRINGDDNKILELNTSDIGVIGRIEELYPKLTKLALKANDLISEEDTDKSQLTKKLKDIDKELRDGVDYVFDANVCEVCAPDGTLYDPFNGKFRFEHIMEALIALYESNMSKEYRAMTRRVQKHTAKYTKK